MFVGGSICSNPGAAPNPQFGLGFAAFGVCFQFLPLLAKCSVSCWYFTDLIMKSNLYLGNAPGKNIRELVAQLGAQIPDFSSPTTPRIFLAVPEGLVGTLYSCKSHKRWFFLHSFVPVLTTAAGEGVEGAAKKVNESHCWKISQSYDAQITMCHCCTPKTCVYKHVCI